MFNKIPDLERRVDICQDFIERKEYVSELQKMVQEIKTIGDNFKQIESDLSLVKDNAEKTKEKLKTQFKDNFAKDQKIASL